MMIPRTNTIPTTLALAACLLTGLGALGAPATAAAVIKLHPEDRHEAWEGWGTSLAWWAEVVGNSPYESAYADLTFTLKDVPFHGTTLPGLGLNVARYNIGGTGRVGDDPDVKEHVPEAWSRAVEGYWKNPADADPASDRWDWSRDANQRAFLEAGLKRGVNNVELFSNAPMWWMTTEKSAAGGGLPAENRRAFAHYSAAVARRAVDVWRWPVSGVEPFNEPGGNWWTYPGGQEGCMLLPADQAPILGDLREELDTRGATDMAIAGSDENQIGWSRRTYDALLASGVQVNGDTKTAASLLARVNSHGYGKHDEADAQILRQKTREHHQGLWMSEYGENDGSGLSLAQTIVSNLNFLQPTVWCVWQILDNGKGWGCVTANIGAGPADPANGRPTGVNIKYYAFAQFTRFLRPGAHVIGSDDPHGTLAAISPAGDALILIAVNPGAQKRIDYDLSGFHLHGGLGRMTRTNTDGSALLRVSRVKIAAGRFELKADSHTIYSIQIPIHRLKSSF